MSDSVVLLLRRSIKAGISLADARLLQQWVCESRAHGETLPGNLLVQLFGECGCLEGSVAAFWNIQKRNNFSWSILLAAFVRLATLQDAKYVYDRMPCQTQVSGTTMLTAFAQKGLYHDAATLFHSLPLRGVSSWNLMLTVYAQSGCLPSSRQVFYRMPQWDRISWNALIAGNAQNGQNREAIEVFRIMDLEGVEANVVTLVSVIDAFSGLGETKGASMIQSCILESEVALGSFIVQRALINMWAKCGNLEAARRIFEQLHQQDVVSWTTMITACAQNSREAEAVELFRKMDLNGVQANRVTFITVLDACSELEDISMGSMLQVEIEEAGHRLDFVTGTALVKLYGTFGQISNAVAIFNRLMDILPPDVALWNAMISAYSRNDYNDEAVRLFRLMKLHGLRPNGVTFLAVLEACTALLDLEEGRRVQLQLEECYGSSSQYQVFATSSLVNMYGKCGKMLEARAVFDTMDIQPTLVSWNTMVGTYAGNGHGNQALNLYKMMVLEGVQPDAFTFVRILHASNHVGLLDDARYYFVSIAQDYGLFPGIEHYRCIVDLLARLGQLDDAEEMIRTMPFHPDVICWVALLGCCKTHGDLERGLVAAGEVLALDPHRSSAFRLLSKMMGLTLDEDESLFEGGGGHCIAWNGSW